MVYELQEGETLGGTGKPDHGWYWIRYKNRIFYSRHIAALAEHIPVRYQLNEAAARSYLSTGFYPRYQSLVDPIAFIPECDTLRLQGGQIYYGRPRPVFQPVPQHNDLKSAAEAFYRTYGKAVTSAMGNSRVGLMLSAGLDSGSAFHLACTSHKDFHSFTHIPLTSEYVETAFRFGNEEEVVRRHARFQGFENTHYVRTHPDRVFDAIDQCTAALFEPGHSIINLYWMLDIYAQAKAIGCEKMLLCGLGNYSVTLSLPAASGPVHHLSGNARWIYKRLKLVRKITHQSLARSPRFIKTLQQLPLPLSRSYPESVARMHLAYAGFGASQRSYNLSGLASLTGLPTEDPTADPQLLHFLHTVPLSMYYQKQLFKKAFHNKMAPEILEQPKKGIQSSDALHHLNLKELKERVRDLPVSRVYDRDKVCRVVNLLKPGSIEALGQLNNLLKVIYLDRLNRQIENIVRA